MRDTSYFDWSRLEMGDAPFRHFSAASVLRNGTERKIYDWLDTTDAWSLTEADFYTQFEFSLLDTTLPEDLQSLIEKDAIQCLTDRFNELCGKSSFSLAGVTAHKLVNGHRIGIHNDYIGKAETHRMVIHITPYWQDSNGGYLMLFQSAKADQVAKLIKPVDNSAFGFEISEKSYHAVSTIYDFYRYSIVYTLREK
jgi:Rps23 Pro-64 3,4-dihydroxylase Tpa1-like proline 4-hydroxylase